MVLSLEDKILIKGLLENNMGARKIIQMFPNKNWKLSTVSYFLKHYRENGTVQIKGGRGRKRSGRSQVNIQRVRQIVENNNPSDVTSARKISRITTIKRTTVQRILKSDLNLKVYKKVYCQKLTIENKRRRKIRCQQLLRRFRSREDISKIWFSDEKVFFLRQPKNTQNNRVYSTAAKKREVPLERLLIPRAHFAESVMVSLGVSKSGKTSVIFIDKNVKINSEVYQQHVLANLLYEIENIDDTYCFQQDGAPSHTSRSTIRYLQENCPEFIEPELWPPNSPDLNPVDYSIWGILESMVYTNYNITTIDELKRRIVYCWDMFSQHIINNCIDQWRRRLQAVVDNEGNFIHNDFL